MEDTLPQPEFAVPEHILQRILTSANCSALDPALETLTKIARTEEGRSHLASKSILPPLLALTKHLSAPLVFPSLSSSLKLLRNLCAGHLRNQDCFVANNGVEIVSTALYSVGFNPDSYENIVGIVRIGLQLLGNVAQAGEEHQRVIWKWLFPDRFMDFVRMRSSGICDPLCMVIYTCCSGSDDRFGELCGVQGIKLMAEIITTVSAVGFGEEWLKWLLSRICFEEHHLPTLFNKLSLHNVTDYSQEQAFLLSVLSERLNLQRDEVFVSTECAMCVFGILKDALGRIDFSNKGKSSLSTGVPVVDVLGYSITLLRDISAGFGVQSSSREGSVDIVDSLISAKLLKVLLNILRGLEPPEVVKRSIPQDEYESSGGNCEMKKCPYKGFRRDLLAVIANCVYNRKYAQDEIRHRNGLILLMQHSARDEDNPFTREWGIWLAKNLFLENEENRKAVLQLELEGAVDGPELARLGLQVKVDPTTKHVKLINKME